MSLLAQLGLDKTGQVAPKCCFNNFIRCLSVVVKVELVNVVDVRWLVVVAVIMAEVEEGDSRSPTVVVEDMEMVGMVLWRRSRW